MNYKKRYIIIVLSILTVLDIIIATLTIFYSGKGKADLLRSSNKLFEEHMYKLSNEAKNNNVESSYTIKEIKIVAGNYREFVAHINYDAIYTAGNDTEVINSKWMMRIKRVSNDKYKILKQGISVDTTGLKSIKDPIKKTYGNGSKPILSLDSPNKYSIRNNRVSVTYDNGKKWLDIPVALDELLNKNELTNLANFDDDNNNELLDEGSYYITPKKTAFVYGDEGEPVKVVISDNKGKSWFTSNVQGSEDEYGYERKFVGFISPKQGYVVLTTSVAMGHQENYIYETNDSGKTWEEIGNTNETYARVVTGAGFANDKIILMCFRYENDNNPTIYRTEDSGKTWKKVYIKLPLKYKDDCATPLCPIFKGSKGVLPVKLRDANKTIQFITNDYGATWRFDKDVIYSHEIKEKK